MAKTISFFNVKTRKKENIPLSKTKKTTVGKGKKKRHALTATGKGGTKLFRFTKG